MVQGIWQNGIQPVWVPERVLPTGPSAGRYRVKNYADGAANTSMEHNDHDGTGGVSLLAHHKVSVCPCMPRKAWWGRKRVSMGESAANATQHSFALRVTWNLCWGLRPFFLLLAHLLGHLTHI